MTDGRRDRRVWLAFLVGASLASAFVVAGATGPSAQPAQPPPQRSLGEALYLRDCAVCHGADGEGTTRGPGLTDVGLASVDFQLRTRRMPITGVGEGLQRADAPDYSSMDIAALVEHSRKFVTRGPDVPSIDLSRANVGKGGELYRLHCAGCHGTAAIGGALVYADTNAPDLVDSPPVEVAEAMLSGPGDMPVLAPDPFGEAETRDIAAYVRELHEPDDRGGFALWHLGPVPEGAVSWIIGLGALLLVARWIGSTMKEEAHG